MSIGSVKLPEPRWRAFLASWAGLCASALAASFLLFGSFLPYRLREASLNGLTGCLVILVCHLSALTAPLLILQMHRSWRRHGLMAAAFILLFFESSVFRATSAASGFYDYLNLANAAGSFSNAVDQYGADAVRALVAVLSLFGILTWLRRMSLRSGSSLQPFLSPMPLLKPGWLLGLSALACCLGFCGSFYLRGHMATRGLTPGYGLPVSLSLSALDDVLSEPPPTARQVPVRPSGSRHILFIIDESVQYDVFAELWSRSPAAAKLPPPLPMLSYANSSAASNAMLRNACDPRWPDRCLKGDSLLGKARAAGYRVIFYDNQKVLQRRDNYFGSLEQSQLDLHRAYDPTDHRADLLSLPDLISDLQPDQPPTFILLNKRGSHFRYETNFTPDQARPGEPAYHTCVRLYSVEFLERLVQSGVLAHTALYFTSDHGQDWQEKVPHGTTVPAFATRAQWEVPALVHRPGSQGLPKLPAGYWLSHFHLAESLNNDLGYDDPEVPGIEQATDEHFILNQDHQALFVFPFRTLGRQPATKPWARRR